MSQVFVNTLPYNSKPSQLPSMVLGERPRLTGDARKKTKAKSN